ncbi:MICAL-like protein 1 [Denticeps clupeoides]|uniref:MICAL-like protein 1 n=1 Tax=Denticeps clupeoides TaxID=299321 RepID=A0AAY4ACG9_9TELE|nr:MICAL-like protein 1 [Denticeps clupeoides]
MGSLKALQEWCRIQCGDYNDVDITNMSTSFRDGLAFCAIIHKHRPDLIDFDSLSKENVYENNRLAFEVAESQLGIPALLDPEDMVSMKVPDRLSIITYVSQYYNFFTNKSHANPPCTKRPSGTDQIEPALKRPASPLEDRMTTPETGSAGSTPKRASLSSVCAACGTHVHLVQRFLVDGRLYHRNCFRCTQCSSTLLPGSYKPGSDPGSLVCTHHFARSSSSSGQPDLAKKPVLSARILPKLPDTPPNGKDLDITPSSQNEAFPQTPPSDSASKSDSLEKDDRNGDGSASSAPLVSTPPNPFDESDEEEKEEDPLRPSVDTMNGHLPQTPLGSSEGGPKPVPAPRRIVEPSPPPRPTPRHLPPRIKEDSEDRRRSLPVPRERSHSPGSQSSDTPKPKDPPWLALVKSESKKKAPPPPGLATPQKSGSVAEEPKPATPPEHTNPFEDDEDEDELQGEHEESLVPLSVVAIHPWYNITQTAEGSGTDTPKSRSSLTPSGSPSSARSKKRPAPRVPRPSPAALSQSQPSSTSPSPAMSTESLSSSSSDHILSRPPAGAGDAAATSQEHPFTKSSSEPAISSPSPTASPSGSSTDPRAHLSPSSSPPPPPPATNTSSAPATPQANRSGATRAQRPPPPRPPAVASLPLTAGTLNSAAQNKRICKENPFNRKASPSHAPPTSRPPKGPRPARPPAPGHGFPLIKRKVQSDQYIPVEDIDVEMNALEQQLDELEQRGVELEKSLRNCAKDEEEESLLVGWFTLIHEKHLLVRRERELVYTAKQQNLEERQADVEYELRCLLNKPEKEWTEEDKSREEELMAELVTIIEQRNQIINSMDQEKQREEEEDQLVAAMLKKKDFHKDPDGEQKKKGGKFKPMKVLKRLSHKAEGPRGGSPRKDKS